MSFKDIHSKEIDQVQMYFREIGQSLDYINEFGHVAFDEKLDMSNIVSKLQSVDADLEKVTERIKDNFDT